MVLLLALHLVVGAGLMAATRSLAGRRLPFLIAGLAPLATVVWLATRLPSVIDGDVRTETRRVDPRSSASTSTSASTASPP